MAVRSFLRSLYRRMLPDISGAAIAEFALAAPVLVLFYCGAYTMSDAIACDRKVVRTARTLTDMTSRYAAVTNSDLQAILDSSAFVLAPYGGSAAWMRITEVQVTDASHAKVVWSKAKNGTALTVGTTLDLPTGLAPTLMQPDVSVGRAGSFFLLGEAGYTYTPLFGAAIMPKSDLYTRQFMLPRLSDSVPLG